MRRLIDKNIIESLKNLRRSLSPRLFKNNLKMQLSSYEVTEDFLEEFSDSIDAADISKCSLTPECIHYLIENDKFDYNIWKEKVINKNIDILVDDDFVSQYHPDLTEILTKVKNISPAIYKKYNSYPSSEVRKNLLLNYTGPEVTVNTILNNIDILQMDIFKIQKIIDEIKSYNSEIQDRILHTTKPLNPLLLLYLMQLVYIPKEVENSIDDLEFIDLDLTEKNPDAPRIINESQNILSSIIEKYPVTTVCKIIEMLFYSAKEILLNSNLLKKLLIECDNLDEQLLTTIYSIFLLTGTREELLNYAKNYNYISLAAVLSL